MAPKTRKKNLLQYLFVHCRSSLPLVALITAVSTLLLGIVLSLHTWGNIPISDLTRDVAAIGQLSAHAGFISQIGLFCWAASATVCFFSAAVLPIQGMNYRKVRQFLIASGLLTLVLGLDDAFLLHESVFPQLGIQSEVVYASYGGFLLFYLFRFYSTIFKTDYVLITMALVFFSASIGVDMLELHGQQAFLLEDGAKLVGIISWLVYFCQVGKQLVNPGAAKQKIGFEQNYDSPSSRRGYTHQTETY